MSVCVWGGGSLICAGGLGINSGALLRQPAWYILIDRRQTGGRNKMTERERFFFHLLQTDTDGVNVKVLKTNGVLSARKSCRSATC